VFESAGITSGTDTQLGLKVKDIEATVDALRRRGVVFEEVHVPVLETVNGIAEIDGNYPSKGTREKGAWFRDSEDNLVGLGQPIG
jgi:hypothetical protein